MTREELEAAIYRQITAAEPTGFYAADKRRRDAAVRTILAAVDDWAAGQMAAAERERIRHIITSRSQGLSSGRGDLYEDGQYMAYASLLQELSDNPRPVIINTSGGTPMAAAVTPPAAPHIATPGRFRHRVGEFLRIWL